ncbi:MAG: oxygen-independent coproporphyrinogen III oxidase [Planctomycetota bacterium]
MKVDLELIRRFNVAGPRYTSYPPATHFTDAVDWAELDARLAEANRARRDLSLYVHLPYCASPCYYCGCTKLIDPKGVKNAGYLDFLEREVDLRCAELDPERKVVQVHLGGGTPTYLSADELTRLGALLQERFRLSANLEAGVEVDPRQLDEAKVEALTAAGFNRVSIGVQDVNPDVQAAVNRVQPFELVEQAVAWFQARGVRSFNLDLIYGLPLQTVDSFRETLERTLELAPSRLAVFGYAHVPRLVKTQRKLEQVGLPSAESRLQLLALTIETLTARGYVYVGMDHFAREDDALAVAQREGTLRRNFQGYSTLSGVEIHGFGMSAISQASGAYWQNWKDLPSYYAALERGELPRWRGYLKTPEDELRHTTIERLMCDLGLDYDALSHTLGVDVREHFQRELASLDDLERDGLLVRDARGFQLTDLGRLLIRNVAMRFDATLQAGQGSQYSRTI